MLKLIVIGNLGREPEMRFTPSGQQVTSFSVASTRKWKNGNGEQQSETTWVRFSAWGKLAEICSQYLHKGSKVYIEGRLQVDANGNPRTFSRTDGTTGTSFECTVNEIEFLSSNGDHTNEEAPEAQEEVVPL